ncbi:MAG: hypothetical protein AB7E39_06220 [Endomicrobiaceae bacterium]
MKYEKISLYDQDDDTFYLETKKLKKEIHKIYRNHTKIFDVVYTEYANGFRYTKCNAESDQSYVFFGCSYVFGYGLDDNETFPYYFSKMTDFDYNIVNCGCSGRSSNTALNILESGVLNKFIKQNSNVKLFVYEMMSKSAKRNFQYTGNVDWIYKNGTFKYPDQPYNFLLKNFSYSYVFNKFFLNIIAEHNKDFYEKYFIKSLEKMNELIRTKYGSQMLIIVWDVDSSLKTKLLNTKINIIFLPDKFIYGSDYKISEQYDGHPAAKANAALAKIIFDYAKNKKLL